MRCRHGDSLASARRTWRWRWWRALLRAIRIGAIAAEVLLLVESGYSLGQGIKARLFDVRHIC